MNDRQKLKECRHSKHSSRVTLGGPSALEAEALVASVALKHRGSSSSFNLFLFWGQMLFVSPYGLTRQSKARRLARQWVSSKSRFGALPALRPKVMQLCLRFRHNNQEHEVIRMLVSGPGNYVTRHQSPASSSPKMKLRYLKLVFPEADEALIFNMLYK